MDAGRTVSAGQAVNIHFLAAWFWHITGMSESVSTC